MSKIADAIDQFSDRLTCDQRIVYARNKIARAIEDFDRYGKNTYGRRDAKRHLVEGLEELIDAKIEDYFAKRNVRINGLDGQ